MSSIFDANVADIQMSNDLILNTRLLLLAQEIPFRSKQNV